MMSVVAMAWPLWAVVMLVMAKVAVAVLKTGARAADTAWVMESVGRVMALLTMVAPAGMVPGWRHVTLLRARAMRPLLLMVLLLLPLLGPLIHPGPLARVAAEVHGLVKVLVGAST